MAENLIIRLRIPSFSAMSHLGNVFGTDFLAPLFSGKNAQHNDRPSISLFGPSGSGKSTFSDAAAEVFNINDKRKFTHREGIYRRKYFNTEIVVRLNDFGVTSLPTNPFLDFGGISHVMSMTISNSRLLKPELASGFDCFENSSVPHLKQSDIILIIGSRTSRFGSARWYFSSMSRTLSWFGKFYPQLQHVATEMLEMKKETGSPSSSYR